MDDTAGGALPGGKGMRMQADGSILIPYKHDRGGRVMLPIPDRRHQIFTFILPDGVQYHFDIAKLTGQILRDPASYDQQTVLMRQENIDHILANNGIEEAHFARLTSADLAKPGILVPFDGDTHVVIDGNHRTIARWRRGIRTMPFWVPTLAQCRPCLLDIPDHIGRLETQQGITP